MGRLNRKYIHRAGFGGLTLKAVAFALLLKRRMGKGGFLRGFSYNRVAALTGTSPSTSKKYIKELSAHGLAYTEGKDILRIRKMHSNSEHRNIGADWLDLSSFKNACRSVQAAAFLLKQASKDRVKSTTRSLANPASTGELKKARRFCSRVVSASKEAHSFVYREFGLSLRKIAEVCGVCVRTAQRIVDYTLSMGWCRKQRHCLSDRCPGANSRDLSEFGYHFTTENYAYRVLASTYSLSPSVVGSFLQHGTL